MSEKERDIWDDAIQSKLEDFEVDTLLGDWEAIADRLPEKAPVPLRRTLRYWVSAAVISLLIVSGGIYLYDREMEDLPIAREIQSSREPTSMDTPVVPVEKTMEQASVPAAIPATTAMKAKMAFGAAKVEVKARMAAFRQNVESTEDRPISESRVISADRSANEEDAVETEAERTNDEEIVVLKNDVLVADATPVSKRKPEKIVSRKWGFGMGGGGLSMGADNLVPQYVTNSSVLKSENLLSLNAFDAEKKDPAKTDIHHKAPIGVGISISRYLNNRFSLQTGLTYSYLRSEWSTNNTYHIENDQRLHFIGIPLSLTYKIAEWNRFMFYASAGGMTEVNVAGKRRMKLFSDEVEIARQSEPTRMKEWLWSVNARAGVSYPIIRFVSAFAEVGAGYYFDNGSEIETIHSEKPFNMSLQFGFRFGF
ncbi:porin family protein [Parabacteroides sp. ZJ-118]|uniref:porin family protein n=1 Tax=Parabacteroides sp. ZJ-118 TaxID=2709398 RepID=UPI0013ED9BDA|nr:porin family protein [Parabacteroides sp. ZJ-118]